MAKTVNISAGGLLVNLDRGLMVGAKVDVKLDFSNSVALECCGQVARCKEYREEKDNAKVFYTVAVTFDDLNESQKALLKNQVDNILSQQNII